MRPGLFGRSRLLLADEAGHALVGRARVAVGLDQDEDDARHEPVGDPHLLAVELVAAVCLLGGCRLDRLHVGAELGLGEAEGGPDLAGGHAREEPLLLLLAAELHQQVGADEVRVDDAGDRDPAAAELLDDHRVGGQVEPHPAVLLGDGHAEQAELLHLLDDRLGVLVRAVVVLGLGDDLLVDELADHLDDRLLLVGLLVEVARDGHGPRITAPRPRSAGSGADGQGPASGWASSPGAGVLGSGAAGASGGGGGAGRGGSARAARRGRRLRRGRGGGSGAGAAAARRGRLWRGHGLGPAGSPPAPGSGSPPASSPAPGSGSAPGSGFGCDPICGSAPDSGSAPGSGCDSISDSASDRRHRLRLRPNLRRRHDRAAAVGCTVGFREPVARPVAVVRPFASPPALAVGLVIDRRRPERPRLRAAAGRVVGLALARRRNGARERDERPRGRLPARRPPAQARPRRAAAASRSAWPTATPQASRAGSNPPGA